jgi:hypothetical protein
MSKRITLLKRERPNLAPRSAVAATPGASCTWTGASPERSPEMNWLTSGFAEPETSNQDPLDPLVRAQKSSSSWKSDRILKN